MQIALGEDDMPTDSPRSRLLILEDCDELIASSAKERSGQGLARLLEPDRRAPRAGPVAVDRAHDQRAAWPVHPAVIRPGRCIAQIEVGTLNEAEARAWLGRDVESRPLGYSLADLVALRDSTAPVQSDTTRPAVGQYL